MHYQLIYSFITAVLITTTSRFRFGSFINPPALFSIGLIIPLLAIFFIQFLNEFIDIKYPLIFAESSEDFFYVSLVYCFSIIIFFLPWLTCSVKNKKIKNSNSLTFASERTYLKRSILLIYPIIFFLIILFMPFPIIQMISGNLDVRDMNQQLIELPMGVLSLILVGSIILSLWYISFYFDYRSIRKHSKKYLIGFLMLLPIFLWNGKRQLLFFFLTIFFIRYLIERRQNLFFKRNSLSPPLLLLASLGLLFFVFNWVDAIRYLGDGSNPLSFLGYITWPARNVFAIYNHLGFDGASNYFQDTHFVFSQLLPSRVIGNDQQDLLNQLLYEPTSPSGFLASWWIDGGVGFVFIGVFVFSLFCLFVYKKRQKNSSWQRIYLLILWCCFTSGIYQHFISLVFFWLPFFFFIVESYVRNIKVKYQDAKALLNKL
jgi:oligosaccharide repeat unit polymerase